MEIQEERHNSNVSESTILFNFDMLFYYPFKIPPSKNIFFKILLNSNIKII